MREKFVQGILMLRELYNVKTKMIDMRIMIKVEIEGQENWLYDYINFVERNDIIGLTNAILLKFPDAQIDISESRR